MTLTTLQGMMAKCAVFGGFGVALEASGVEMERRGGIERKRSEIGSSVSKKFIGGIYTKPRSSNKTS